MPGEDSPQSRTRLNGYTHEGAAPHSDVVLDLLGDLRAGGYKLTAWARFLVRSWRISRGTASAQPRLVRSWRRVAAGLTLVEVAALSAEALTGGKEGRDAAWRAAPGAALCLACTMGDVYAHLGMNHDASGAPVRDTLGLPTILTLIRSATAGLLSGHLLGRTPPSRSALYLALATAGLTDIADGQIARKTQRVSRLGAYLDSEADFGVALSMTLTLASRRALPGWLVAALLARWLTPLAYALSSYFWQGRRVPIGSTVVGKVAGVAQAATLGMALLPERPRRRASGTRGALHVIMVTLLVAAPLVQLAQARYTPKREGEMRRDGQR